jgi:hypothetical protein
LLKVVVDTRAQSPLLFESNAAAPPECLRDFLEELAWREVKMLEIRVAS